jgi:secondary thiamine-phosphate synthase enzyme
MKYKRVKVRSNKREELISITSTAQDFVTESAVGNGKLSLYVPHTTAAVTINETADPDVATDIINGLNKLISACKPFRHAEGNSDAHIKSTLVGCSMDIPIIDNKLVLGTWQGIFFCEFDGPRTREILLTTESV